MLVNEKAGSTLTSLGRTSVSYIYFILFIFVRDREKMGYQFVEQF